MPRAVLRGRFKYHGRHRVRFGNPMDWPWAPARLRGPWLFDLQLDADESYDVSDRHPDSAGELRGMLDERIREQRENPRGWRSR